MDYSTIENNWIPKNENGQFWAPTVDGKWFPLHLVPREKWIEHVHIFHPLFLEKLVEKYEKENN